MCIIAINNADFRAWGPSIVYLNTQMITSFDYN